MNKIIHSEWFYFTYIGMALIIYRLTFATIATTHVTMYLVAEVIATIVLVGLLMLNQNNRGALRHAPKKKSLTAISAKQFLGWLAVITFLQFLFDPYMFGILSRLYKMLGPSQVQDVSQYFALPNLTDTDNLLITCIIAPIFEEILFRGLLLNAMVRYGEYFSIVSSSIAFGVAHGSFIQGTFAFLCGVLFGTVYLQYGLKATIPLHMLTNILFGTLLDNMFYASGILNNQIILVLVVAFCITFAIGILYRWFTRQEKVAVNYKTMAWLLLSPSWWLYVVFSM
ncbi:lysostaphin resistance A-like protein [Schleiferilactobacillus perolens]|uniref:CPBP family intramembrane glutamic endopeptidase n=1 Tax=Schleiferilactobacillus perolens TaxID=100468 RepID=UPI0039E75AF2